MDNADKKFAEADRRKKRYPRNVNMTSAQYQQVCKARDKLEKVLGMSPLSIGNAMAFISRAWMEYKEE